MKELWLEGRTCPFSEKFLQIIWNERHLSVELQCTDGCSLRVLQPGTWNGSEGPDFRGATLLFDGSPEVCDVEIHRRSSDWYRHGHEGDERYAGVRLHVVWEDDAPPVSPQIRTLVLANCLKEEWRRLLWSMEDACYPQARQIPPGDCALRWAMTSDERVRSILVEAGLFRFATKGSALLRQAVDCGQEQALYEAIFEVLGYKANRAPFRELARRVPLATLTALPDNLSRAARLFGEAGLIPDGTQAQVVAGWEEYVAGLWDRFWADGGTWSVPVGWNLSGTRPFNSPFRRLAAGVSLLERTSYAPAAWLKAQVRSACSPKELRQRLERLTASEPAWHSLRDFTHPISPPAELLGRPRFLDLAANVLLPFAFAILETEDGTGSPAAIRAKEAFLRLPSSQSNSRLKEASLRFLTPPSRTHDLLKSTAHQQGLLDIYAGFCLALDSNCDH
ncbi:MAG: DUF2851 family protein, partial [Victivallales bacterium]|nr:DUF2851 family protein [Victivallales bacterium]